MLQKLQRFTCGCSTVLRLRVINGVLTGISIQQPLQQKARNRVRSTTYSIFHTWLQWKYEIAEKYNTKQHHYCHSHRILMGIPISQSWTKIRSKHVSWNVIAGKLSIDLKWNSYYKSLKQNFNQDSNIGLWLGKYWNSYFEIGYEKVERCFGCTIYPMCVVTEIHFGLRTKDIWQFWHTLPWMHAWF